MKRIIFFALSLLFFAPIVRASAAASAVANGDSAPKVAIAAQPAPVVAPAVNKPAAVVQPVADQPAPTTTVPATNSSAPVVATPAVVIANQEAPATNQPVVSSAPVSQGTSDAVSSEKTEISNIDNKVSTDAQTQPAVNTLNNLVSSVKTSLGTAVEFVKNGCVSAQGSCSTFVQNNKTAVIVAATVATLAASYVVYKKCCKKSCK